MVKRDLVEGLVNKFNGITKRDMTAVVDTLFETMAQTLTQGAAVEVRGVGRFRIKERRPIKGRNPKTEASVDIPRRWVVSFRPADSLTKRINQYRPRS